MSEIQKNESSGTKCEAIVFPRLNRSFINTENLCVWTQMETAKKAYHMACKEEKLAAAREANGKTEASVTPDQQKKLHEKVDKCKQDVQKVGKNGKQQPHSQR